MCENDNPDVIFGTIRLTAQQIPMKLSLKAQIDLLTSRLMFVAALNVCACRLLLRLDYCSDDYSLKVRSQQ